jgi:putative sterol carrier protein
MRRAVDHRTAPAGPFTVQWEFADAEPWHLRVDNGSSAVSAGRAPHVDLEVRCGYETWVDIIAGRLDPARALATGRLRPRGTPRALWRARGIF